jgi:hypothetical protein
VEAREVAGVSGQIANSAKMCKEEQIALFLSVQKSFPWRLCAFAKNFFQTFAS